VRPVAAGELPLKAIHSAFQPVVDLDTLAVVGYEALARGPAGTPFERPDVLFEAGRATGRLAELDSACRTAAFDGARKARLTAPTWLFVNAEPEVLHTWALSPIEEMDGADLPVMVEITERALTHRPASCSPPSPGCGSSAGGSRWTTSARTRRRSRCCRCWRRT
jgi:EAL domain-containing protein (putative c-di-GMP-specific phosphodiesterase class I)